MALLQGGGAVGFLVWFALREACRLTVEQQNRSFADGLGSLALLRMTPGGRTIESGITAPENKKLTSQAA